MSNTTHNHFPHANSGKSYIMVTGAAGFIGSCMVSYLNAKGIDNLILVDEFNDEEKNKNLIGKKFEKLVERDHLFEWLGAEKPGIDFVFHLGARTDTTEFDYSVLQKLNVEYSQRLWNFCVIQDVPLVYASSAATYGSGEMGYNDDNAVTEYLKPMNPYGRSKNDFDKWVLHEEVHPPFWAGLKFFNVFGPNEYHKGRMASVVFHSFNQIEKTGKVKLFQSHRPDCAHGEQLRDFIYVKDLLNVCFWLMEIGLEINDVPSFQNGIYNLGSGVARSFNDLAKATFNALNLQPQIEYIPIPEDIRDSYQYYTKANMDKLRSAGYSEPFHSLETAVTDYVTNYLVGKKYF